MNYVVTYLPSIIEGMGFSKLLVHIMTIPPNIFSCLVCLLAGYSSGHYNEHSFHSIVLHAMGALGFALIGLINKGKVVMLFGLSVALCGPFAALPIVAAWFIKNVCGRTNLVILVSFCGALGQIGGVITPQVTIVIQFETKREFNLKISFYTM